MVLGLLPLRFNNGTSFVTGLFPCLVGKGVISLVIFAGFPPLFITDTSPKHCIVLVFAVILFSNIERDVSRGMGGREGRQEAAGPVN